MIVNPDPSSTSHRFQMLNPELVELNRKSNESHHNEIQRNKKKSTKWQDGWANLARCTMSRCLNHRRIKSIYFHIFVRKRIQILIDIDCLTKKVMKNGISYII